MKFTQTAVFALALAGLTACAGTSSQNTVPYGNRTAGDAVIETVDAEAMPRVRVNNGALAACKERENRLMEMNRSCYRK
jgi:hypothetical protein